MATFAAPPPTKTVIAAAGPFTIALEHEDVMVVSIPLSVVPTFAWWVIREYCLDRRRKTCFHSILLDDDGLSLVCSAASVPALEALNTSGQVTINPQKWRAFVINMYGGWTGTLVRCVRARVHTGALRRARHQDVTPVHFHARTGGCGGSAEEFPGAVHHLAESLSAEGMSILHISTFESEVFLVQVR